MPGAFTDKVVVVTGGANGIGRATVERFAREGAIVAALDREADTLEGVAAALAAEGAPIHGFAADLARAAEISAVFGDVVGRLGPVDILVNNVGQTARAQATEFWCSDPDTIEFVLNISLMATLRCSREVAPEMRRRGRGKIVNIASDSAIAADAGIADYVTAKSGVMGFTRALARELAPFQVNVNAVAPGPTLTRGPLQMPKAIFERGLAEIPMGEMCQPSDIANSVAFLASDEARFVTGQVLVVNGGRTFY